MNEAKEDRKSIYEIGYHVVASVPEEKVQGEAEIFRKFISDYGASVISEEVPRRMRLAYPMRRKTVSGSYEKYNEVYFGWIKFEVSPEKIEIISKFALNHPSILRSLVVSTVRENTYLGKRASDIAASLSRKSDFTETKNEARVEVKKEASPMSIEEVDKSIEEMVKEV